MAQSDLVATILKLHLSLGTYWDASKECHFLVGTTRTPIAVKDEGLLGDLVVESKKNVATKVTIALTE